MSSWEFIRGLGKQHHTSLYLTLELLILIPFSFLTSVTLWSVGFNATLFAAVTMDLDPSVEPGLDSLSLTLPLPYRVGLIIVLGMWGAHEEKRNTH